LLFSIIYKQTFELVVMSVFATHLISFVSILYCNSSKGYFRVLDLKISTIDKKAFCNLVKFMALGLISLISIQSIRLFIRPYLGASYGWEEVGIWQAVIRLSDLGSYFMTVVFTASFYPAICKTPKSSSINKMILKFYLFIVMPFSFGLFIVYLFREQLLIFLFDEKFLSAAPFVGVTFLGDVFRMLSFTIGYVFLAKETFLVNSLIQISQIIIFGSLSFYMIKDGVLGLSYAYLYSFIIYFILIASVYFYKNRTLD